MIHIAGGIILAVLGLRALNLFTCSLQTEGGQTFWLAVASIGSLLALALVVSLMKGDFHAGLAFLVIVGVGIAWCIHGKPYDNSSVDWRSQKPLGKRIR